jgi:hypothetical protein
MAEKPRVKAPKKRVPPKSEAGLERHRLLVVTGTVAAAVAIAAAAFFLLGAGGLVGGGTPGEAAVRTDLENAGCTLQAVKAQKAQHTLTPDGTAKWNTDPPTSGPHFGFNPDGSAGTVIWGAYTEPVQLARIVHNLEHGGIFIFYGDKVPESTVAKLQAFYEKHTGGTVLAPYPKLGNKVALGAWVADGAKETGYLAKCANFDDGAFAAFISAFQYRGPEAYPAGSLLPGGN